MSNKNESIQSLNLTLSSASKRKRLKENNRVKLLNLERQYSEELSALETQEEYTSAQLKDLKEQISKIRHQVSLVEICAISEKIKVETHLNDLKNRVQSFDNIFDTVRNVTELRQKELKQNEEEELELHRTKEKEIAQKSEELSRQILAVEKECENIERECAVLKKRNAAIMLKMRRKLVETENIRKDLLKQKNTA